MCKVPLGGPRGFLMGSLPTPPSEQPFSLLIPAGWAPLGLGLGQVAPLHCPAFRRHSY